MPGGRFKSHRRHKSFLRILKMRNSTVLRTSANNTNLISLHNELTMWILTRPSKNVARWMRSKWKTSKEIKTRHGWIGRVKSQVKKPGCLISIQHHRLSYSSRNDGFMHQLRELKTSIRYTSTTSTSCELVAKSCVLFAFRCRNFTIFSSLCLLRSCSPQMYFESPFYEHIAVSCLAFYNMHFLKQHQ